MGAPDDCGQEHCRATSRTAARLQECRTSTGALHDHRQLSVRLQGEREISTNPASTAVVLQTTGLKNTGSNPGLDIFLVQEYRMHAQAQHPSSAKYKGARNARTIHQSS